jgi:hypothetical protein
MKKSVLLMALIFSAENIWGMQSRSHTEVISQSNREHLLQLARQLADSIDAQALSQLSLHETELRSMIDDLAQQYTEFDKDQSIENFREQSEIANNFFVMQNALRVSVEEIDTAKDDCRPIFDQSIVGVGLLKLSSLRRFVLDPSDISELIDKRKYTKTLGYKNFELNCPLLKYVRIEGIPSKDNSRKGMEYCFVKGLLKSKNLESFEISGDWWKETKYLIKKDKWDVYENDSFVHGKIRKYSSSRDLTESFR